jgi:uncharacterized protein YcgL (UPF0745 family)
MEATNKQKQSRKGRQEFFRNDETVLRISGTPRVIRLHPQLPTVTERSEEVKKPLNSSGYHLWTMPKMPDGYIKARKHDPL